MQKGFLACFAHIVGIRCPKQKISARPGEIDEGVVESSEPGDVIVLSQYTRALIALRDFKVD